MKPPATLRAGAGRAAIELPDQLFPVEGFTGLHDPLHARVLLVDCGARVALVSIELTSLPAEQVTLLRQVVGETCGLPAEGVWICVTHTMSAPHIAPRRMWSTGIDGAKSAMLATAVEGAVRSAASQAASGLQGARVGHVSGPCDVNVNRDVLTPEGWWLGCNEKGFSDKTVTVVRFEALDGRPIAVLFSHCVRPAVTERGRVATESLVTADLAGAASTMIEKEHGDSLIGIFFMGAAADQSPRLSGIGSPCADGDSAPREKYSSVEAIGEHLASEVMRLSEGLHYRTRVDPMILKAAEIRLEGQELPDTDSIRPTKEHLFASGPDRVEPLELVLLGDVALVGVRPELSCRTGVDIRERSPLSETLVLTMVNGGAKCMAEAEAYDRITYEAMNSPFARGSAERLADKAVAGLFGMVGQ